MSIASSSDDSIDRAIDEYCEDSSDRSSSSSSDSSGGSTDENYSSGLLGFPLRSSKNSLGEPLAPKLVPHPTFLRPTLRMRKKLFLVVQ